MSKLTDAIAAAIRASDENPAQIAKGAGVARSQISRLLNGKLGLNSKNIEKIADYLGLEIVIRPRRRASRKGR